MMNSGKRLWTVKWDTRAQKDVKKLPQKEQLRIADKVAGVLQKNPYAGEKLSGRFKKYYRYIVGNYRVVYKLEKGELIILILRVADRKDVYKLPL